ncbi:MAG: hypothetical protein AB1351_02735 [Thermoproteota archaeon]
MRQWHVEHMQKIILKYVKGLSADANSWERRNHKKYGNITHVCRQIEYDMRHGVTKDEIMASLSKIQTHSSYQALRQNSDSMRRLSEIEEHFASPKTIMPRW